MSDKKHVHKSPDQGMTKTCLLCSHLKTHSLLQLLFLFLTNSWKVPHVYKAWVIRSFWWGLGVTPSSWVFPMTVLTFAFAVLGNVISQFSAVMAHYLVSSSAKIHGLSLPSICLCWCVCQVWRIIVGWSLRRCIWSSPRWYGSSSVKGVFPWLLFFEWYFNVAQPLFYSIIVVWNGYPSSV